MLHGASHSIEGAQRRVVAERDHKPPTHTLPSLKQVVSDHRLIKFDQKSKKLWSQCNICRQVFTNKCDKNGTRPSDNALRSREDHLQRKRNNAERDGKTFSVAERQFFEGKGVRVGRMRVGRMRWEDAWPSSPSPTPLPIATTLCV